MKTITCKCGKVYTRKEFQELGVVITYSDEKICKICDECGRELLQENFKEVKND